MVINIENYSIALTVREKTLCVYIYMYIPEYKSRIFGGFYKNKVGGSTYI